MNILYFLKSRKYFRLFVMFCVILNYLPFNNSVMGSILFYAQLIYFGCILFFDFFDKRIKFNTPLILFSLFLFSLVFSTLINWNLSSIYSFIRIFEMLILIYGFFTNEKNTSLDDLHEQILFILKFLLISLSLITFISLLQYFFIFDLDSFRYAGLFSNPGSSGTISLFLLLFLLFLYKNETNMKIKFLYLLIAIQSAYFLYLSDSRTAFIALLFSAFAILITYFKIKLKYIMITIPVIIIIIVIIISYRYIFNPLYSSTFSFESLENFLNIITSYRYYIYKDAINLFISSPLFGVGPNNLVEASKIVLTSTSEILMLNMTNPHNLVLNLLASSGLVGTSFFLTGLYTSLINFKQNKYIDVYRYGFIALFVITFFEAMLNPFLIFSYGFPTMIFWLFLGFIIKND